MGLVYGAGVLDPQIFMPASAMWPTTANGCTGPTKVNYAVNGIDLLVLEFAQAVASYAQFGLILPTNYNAGTMTFRAIWSAAAGSAAQTITWGLQGRSYPDNQAVDQAFGTAQEIADALIAVATVHQTAESPAITLAGTPTAGSYAQFQFYRKGTGSLASTARLLGILIKYGAKDKP